MYIHIIRHLAEITKKKEKKKDGKEVKKLNMRKDRERTSCVQVQSKFSLKEGKT